MNNGHSSLRGFGNCRLDLKKKLLWAGDKPVQLPLKATELLCVLVEGRGEVLTKEEIWQSVWDDTFVEETNLTHNIYLLRKALGELGQKDLIETVPRRGYRFSAEVHEIPDDEIVLQRHALTTTTIEFQDSEVPSVQARAWVIDRRTAFASVAVVLTALLGGSAIWLFQSSLAHTEAAEIRSIAVLPLRSLTESADDKLLSRGFADALITSLGSINKVRVVSTSVLSRYTDAQKEPFEIGKDLAVDSVLDGTFQKANGKLRVTLRLIRTTDGAQIWSRSFDESETEIFKLQDTIAAETARVLKWNLSDEEQRKIAKRYTEDREAYEAYLRGRFFFDKREASSYQMAISEFEHAIKLDPNYALAYTGLADVYALQAIDYSKDSAALYEKAKLTAMKALALDGELAEAHTSLAWILRIHDWNWIESEKEFKRAIELNPNYYNAHQWYSLLLMTLNRKDESLAEIEKAKELSPTTPIVLDNYFSVKFRRGEMNALVPIADQIKSLGADDYRMALIYTRAYAASEQYQKVIDLANEFSVRYPDRTNYYMRAIAAIAYAKVGDVGRSNAALQQLEKNATDNTETGYQLAFAYAGLGRKDDAIEQLQKCLDAHDDRLMWIKVESTFDLFRDDPRFREILKKMNLSDV